MQFNTNKIDFIHAVIYLALLISISTSARAQEQEGESVPVNTQFWSAYGLYSNFKTNWLGYVEIEYEQLVSEGENWYSLWLFPSVEYYPTNKWDLTANFTTAYTLQANKETTFEIRPVIGTRYHITRSEKRVPINIHGELQFRFISNLSTGENTESIRFRLRTQAMISVNRKTILEDKNFFLRVFGEYFMNMNDNVEERFWNVASGVLGVNYRFNYNWRAEVRYIVQNTKNTRDQELPSSINHIVYLRLVTFLN